MAFKIRDPGTSTGILFTEQTATAFSRVSVESLNCLSRLAFIHTPDRAVLGHKESSSLRIPVAARLTLLWFPK